MNFCERSRLGPADRDIRHLPHYAGGPPLLHEEGRQTVSLKSRPKSDPKFNKMISGPNIGPGQHNPKLLPGINDFRKNKKNSGNR